MRNSGSSSCRPSSRRAEGLSGISPRQRPTVSPRAYKASLDLLRVRDCLWARMRPSEIARRLGKDKAWVSRQIKKLEDDLVTAYRAPEESALVRENFAQLDSLLAKSLQLVARSKDSKRQLAAIRTATDVIRQRARYEMMVGFVRRREGTTPMRLSKGDALLASLQEELPPNSVLAALEKLVELRKQPKLFKTRVGESVFK